MLTPYELIMPLIVGLMGVAVFALFIVAASL